MVPRYYYIVLASSRGCCKNDLQPPVPPAPVVLAVPGLVHVNTEPLQVRLGLLDLGQEFLVCLGHVVERHDAQAQAAEEVGAEGDEEPEGELVARGKLSLVLRSWQAGGRGRGGNSDGGSGIRLE